MPERDLNTGLSRAIDVMPNKEPRILRRRISEHVKNMQAVVDGIKTAVHRDPERPNPIFD